MKLYERMVGELYKVNMFHPAKMGLANIKRLYEALGCPASSISAVHVAGTNGKGSVALKISRSLQLGGVKTGLFISPHISCFRERMQVNGELISEETVEHLLPKIFETCKAQDIPATFFEITTSLAFMHFEEAGADAMVIETGMGGRLDATNIISPALSVVTSIGLDHTRILGDTIEEIAVEKAGIFKPGVPALVGDDSPLTLLKSIADDRGSPFFRWHDVLSDSSAGDDSASASVDFDAENSRLAEAAVKLLGRSNPGLHVEEAALRKGLKQLPPCRFEIVEVSANEHPVGPTSQAADSTLTVVLDVAHNPHAITKLFDKLSREFPGRRIRPVVALSASKNVEECLSIILRHASADRIHFAEAPTRRMFPSSELLSTLEKITGGEVVGARKMVRSGDMSVRRALRDAIEEAARSGEGPPENSEKDLVVVCGSLYMMADARQELGFVEPQDSEAVGHVVGWQFRSTQDNIEISGTNV